MIALFARRSRAWIADYVAEYSAVVPFVNDTFLETVPPHLPKAQDLDPDRDDRAAKTQRGVLSTRDYLQTIRRFGLIFRAKVLASRFRRSTRSVRYPKVICIHRLTGMNYAEFEKLRSAVFLYASISLPCLILISFFSARPLLLT